MPICARAALCLALAAAHPAGAATLQVRATDAAGAPVESAVAWAVPIAVGAPARPKREAVIEQVDKAFVPLVTVVQAGTAVRFPNRDTVRHHVYSFSPAKAFEIKLYAGTTAAPVVFDKAGEVVLGCNIHDGMLAYVYVVDTPFFAKTGADGLARLEGLPAGEYEVRLWHPGQAEAPAPRRLKLRADEEAAAPFAVRLKPAAPKPAAR